MLIFLENSGKILIRSAHTCHISKISVVTLNHLRALLSKIVRNLTNLVKLQVMVNQAINLNLSMKTPEVPNQSTYLVLKLKMPKTINQSMKTPEAINQNLLKNLKTTNLLIQKMKMI